MTGSLFGMKSASKLLGTTCVVLAAGVWIVTITMGSTPDDIGMAVAVTGIVATAFAVSLLP
jgi:hypothetical protein